MQRDASGGHDRPVVVAKYLALESPLKILSIDKNAMAVGSVGVHKPKRIRVRIPHEKHDLAGRRGDRNSWKSGCRTCGFAGFHFSGYREPAQTVDATLAR